MRTLVLLLLLAVFLGGYQLGRIQQSPDLFGWIYGAEYRLPHDADYAMQTASPHSKPELDPTAPETLAVEVGGKTYVIGQQYKSDFKD